MELKEAVETLKFLVETDDEKEALITLVTAANSSGNTADKASYRQVTFIQSLAFAGDVDAMEEIRGMGIKAKTPKALTKKEATKVIKEFISRGYQEALEASR